jgi:hypothetical protein
VGSAGPAGPAPAEELFNDAEGEADGSLEEAPGPVDEADLGEPHPADGADFGGPPAGARGGAPPPGRGGEGGEREGDEVGPDVADAPAEVRVVEAGPGDEAVVGLKEAGLLLDLADGTKEFGLAAARGAALGDLPEARVGLGGLVDEGDEGPPAVAEEGGGEVGLAPPEGLFAPVAEPDPVPKKVEAEAADEEELLPRHPGEEGEDPPGEGLGPPAGGAVPPVDELGEGVGVALQDEEGFEPPGAGAADDDAGGSLEGGLPAFEAGGLAGPAGPAGGGGGSAGGGH